MTAKVKIRQRQDGTFEVERFTPLRRIEHLMVILTFVILVLTGFPQKFYDTSWAAWALNMCGGLDSARLIHRVSGLIFSFHLFAHLAGIAIGTLAHKLTLSLLPTTRDIRDVFATLGYYLGKRSTAPAYPKFDYRQKFEYIGIVLGGLVMVFTGLMLLYPGIVAAILPGQFIAAAKVAHTNEAMLAFLVLLIWHVYGSHFSPEVFPMDKTIFTGYITKEELKHRHTLEFARLFPEESLD
ncbi:MAG: hypothetical protein A2X86_02065 [Bdellovibrionales bacterium GWA2_49_15]|nr:MAG: hypothetical protein A2X86_02065 [Bdellovibrionales bacterium GWA2_49_15]